MAKRGRPAADNPPVVFYINLRLYRGVNDDLIAYLESAPPRLRAQYVLLAMQRGSQAVLPAAPADEAGDEDLTFEDLLQ